MRNYSLNQTLPSSHVVPDPLLDLSPWWPRPLPEAVVDRIATADEKLVRELFGSLVVLRVNNYPTPENVAAVGAWRPEAVPLLAHWAETWRRSFPEGLASVVGTHVNEGPLDHYAKFYEDNEDRERKALEKGDLSVAAVPRFWKLVRDVVEVAGERSWMAHVVDDAETAWALRSAVPGEAWISLKDVLFRLVRHDIDGTPILEREQSPSSRSVDRALKSNRMSDDDPYWGSPAFLSRAGRRFATARNAHEIAIVLAAMAGEGQRKAFLKAVESKGGTWTVDLADVRGPVDAAAAVAAATMPWTIGSRGAMVQEHLPFDREQRFFVVGGRIAASVCSDRHLSAADKRPGRILDERIAVLTRPEIGEGSYDRGHTTHVVDRATAAGFARCAHALSKALAKEGILDYVVDVGSTARGVVPIELNSLYMSGPYCLDRTRFVQAKLRRRDRAMATFRTLLEDLAAARCPAEDVAAVVEEVEATARTVTRILWKFVDHVPSVPSKTSSKTPSPGRDELNRTSLHAAIDDASERVRQRRAGFAVAPLDGGPLEPGSGDPMETVALAILKDCVPLMSIPFDFSGARGRLVGARLPRRPTRPGEYVVVFAAAAVMDGRVVAMPIEYSRLKVRNDEAEADLARILLRTSGFGMDGLVLFDLNGATASVALAGEGESRTISVRRRFGAGMAEERLDIMLDQHDAPSVGFWNIGDDGKPVGHHETRTPLRGTGFPSREVDGQESGLSPSDDASDFEFSAEAFLSREIDPSPRGEISDEFGIVENGVVVRTLETLLAVEPAPVVSLLPDRTRRGDAIAFMLLGDAEPLFSIPFSYEVDGRKWSGRLCGARLTSEPDASTRIGLAYAACDESGLWTMSPVDFWGNPFGERVEAPLHGRIVVSAEDGMETGTGRFTVFVDGGGRIGRLCWVPGASSVVRATLSSEDAEIAMLEFPAGGKGVAEIVGLGEDGKPTGSSGRVDE